MEGNLSKLTFLFHYYPYIITKLTITSDEGDVELEDINVKTCPTELLNEIGVLSWQNSFACATNQNGKLIFFN